MTVTDVCGSSDDITIRNTTGEWDTLSGCSQAAAGTDYIEYRYWEDSGESYRARLRLIKEDGTYRTWVRDCPELSAENFGYFGCIHNSSGVPWSTINGWFDEVLANSGFSPSIVCGVGTTACMIFVNTTSCGGYKHKLGYQAYVYQWSCP